MTNEWVPIKQGKYYRMVVRPALLYRSERWTVKKNQKERGCKLADGGGSQRSRTKNDYIKGRVSDRYHKQGKELSATVGGPCDGAA